MARRPRTVQVIALALAVMLAWPWGLALIAGEGVASRSRVDSPREAARPGSPSEVAFGTHRDAAQSVLGIIAGDSEDEEEDGPFGSTWSPHDLAAGRPFAFSKSVARSHFASVISCRPASLPPSDRLRC